MRIFNISLHFFLRRSLVFSLLIMLILGVLACSNKTSITFPGTEEGAKQLLSLFLKSGADYKVLSKKLEANKEDYLAYFKKDVAEKVFQKYKKLYKRWKGLLIKPKKGQTELLLWKTSVEELQKWTGNAKDYFPGGYKKIASQLKPGFTVYRFKFVKPGKKLGMAYDGLVYINNHWVIFPKPWKVLR